MQLLSIVIGQLGSVTLLLSSINSGLSLTNLSLISLIINNEQHLTGSYGLSFFHINLGQEALNLWTNFNILNTLNNSRVCGLHVGI